MHNQNLHKERYKNYLFLFNHNGLPFFYDIIKYFLKINFSLKKFLFIVHNEY